MPVPRPGEYMLVLEYYSQVDDRLQELDVELNGQRGHLKLPGCPYRYCSGSSSTGVKLIRIRYSEGPLFRKSTIPTNFKPNPKADPNRNPNPNFNPNVSTVVRICTMDFRNSGPS